MRGRHDAKTFNEARRRRPAALGRSAGGARRGFPVAETTRVYDERGRAFWTETVEVTELSTAALDDAVFSVPAGYTRAEPREARDPSVLSRLLSVFRRT